MRPQDDEDIERRIARLEDPTSAAFDERTLQDTFSAMDQGIRRTPARTWQDIGREIMHSRVTQMAAAAAILVGIGVLARHLVSTAAESSRATPPAVVTTLSPESGHEMAAPASRDERPAKELALAQRRFIDKDVDGLVRLLETGLDQTKVQVAGYLAELGARQAVPALQRLASAWTGEPNANPFAQAVAHIGVSKQEPNIPPLEKTAAKVPTPPQGKILSFRFQVVDKVTGQPLPDALVHSTTGNAMYACNAIGYLQVDLVDEDRRLESDRRFEFSVTRPEYVGMCMAFQDPNEAVLSTTHLVALDPGTRVGGIVQGATGLPIEGATVRFIVRLNRNDYPMEPNVSVDSQQKTDASGRWRCDTAPADLLGLVGARAGSWEIYIGVQHVDYCYQGGRVDSTSLVQALRDQSFRTTLYEGLTFRGRIVDVNDRPIAGAQVNSRTTAPDGTFITGPNGTFAIPHLNLGTSDIDLEIQADGYPKTRRKIECPPDMREVQIVLGAGRMLRGHVVDQQGRPVADAYVYIDGWQLPLKTGSDGRFLVGGDSVDKGIVRVDKRGFDRAAQQVEGQPADESLEFVLHKALVASGQVLDAVTGRPVEWFKVRRGMILSHDGRIGVDWSLRAVPGQAGRYQCDFGCFYFSSSGEHVVAIVEADGYLPAQSRPIAQDENEPVVDLTLTPGTGPAGTVVDVNGLPLAEAAVYAVREKVWNGGIIYNGSIYSDCPKVEVRTGPDGRFSFEPMYQLRHLVAVADQGIAGMTVSEFEKTGDLLVLLPWATVRGTVRLAGSPAQNRQVQVESLPDAATRFGFTWGLPANTDEHGAFQIKRVPPGEFTLLDKTYQVAPGQVLNLDLTADPNAS